MSGALDATSRAWERSGMDEVGGAALWGLDALVGVSEANAGGSGCGGCE